MLSARAAGLRDDEGGDAADAVLVGAAGAARCAVYCCGAGGLWGCSTSDMIAARSQMIQLRVQTVRQWGLLCPYALLKAGRRVVHDQIARLRLVLDYRQEGPQSRLAVLQRLVAVERWRPRRGSIKGEVRYSIGTMPRTIHVSAWSSNSNGGDVPRHCLPHTGRSCCFSRSNGPIRQASGRAHAGCVPPSRGGTTLACPGGTASAEVRNSEQGCRMRGGEDDSGGNSSYAVR